MDNQNTTSDLDSILINNRPTSMPQRNQICKGNSGLFNAGNTCYMNAAIQTISHTYFIRNYLMSDEQKIIVILLENAKKILADIKIFHSEEILAEINTKVDDPNYTPNMLTVEEKNIILNNTMTYQIIRLFKGMWGDKNATVNPIGFKRIFAEVRNKFFYGNDQHDAEEAYSCIVQKMQEELGIKCMIRFRSHNNAVGEFLVFKQKIQLEIKMASSEKERQHLSEIYAEKKKSMSSEALIVEAYREMKKYYGSSYSRISEIFTGFYHSTIKCPRPDCRNACNKFDAYFQIGFELPQNVSKPTISDCMDMFCKEETLDQNNMWKCDSCKNMVPAKKQLLLWTNPAILVVQLKRFGVDRRRKDTRFIDYPLTNLDISSMMSPVYKDTNTKNYCYDLYSVINHVGGINGGHYYSFCLDEKSGNWYVYDDTTVKKISINDVVNNNAYILFYIRQDKIEYV